MVGAKKEETTGIKRITCTIESVMQGLEEVLKLEYEQAIHIHIDYNIE